MQYSSLQMSTAIATWIATALLHMQNKGRDSFRTNEIVDMIRKEGLVNTSHNTLMAHITVHCVANTKPWPNVHRKLFRVSPGWYRLYKDGDEYHPARRNGQSVPPIEKIPLEYRKTVEWYNEKYNIDTKPKKVESHGLQFTSIENNGFVKIPIHILDKLSLQENDLIAFVENSDGEVVLKKARIEVE